MTNRNGTCAASDLPAFFFFLFCDERLEVERIQEAEKSRRDTERCEVGDSTLIETAAAPDDKLVVSTQQAQR
jgi:hypothetical protein